ncbi:MAG: YtxH domain-containing protein [Dehalococcoidia bacterium]|nr:YtxH domain-containing protein [Dehalococcoidia bacterium]
MNRNLKRNLTILAASAAVGVVAGILIAPRRGKESRQSLKRNLGRFYPFAPGDERVKPVPERPAGLPWLAAVSGPDHHS